MVKSPPDGHGAAGSSEQRAQVEALQAGTDMVCQEFGEALDTGGVGQAALDTAVRRVLAARVRCRAHWMRSAVGAACGDHPAMPAARAVSAACLIACHCVSCCRRQGHFNPPDQLPWGDLRMDSVQGRPEHLGTARELAAKGTVLLKNADVSCTRLVVRMGCAAACWRARCPSCA